MSSYKDMLCAIGGTHTGRTSLRQAHPLSRWTESLYMDRIFAFLWVQGCLLVLHVMLSCVSHI